MTITEGYRAALVLACKQLARRCVDSCPVHDIKLCRANKREACYKICMRFLMAKARRGVRPAPKRRYTQPTWRSKREKDEHEGAGS